MTTTADILPSPKLNLQRLLLLGASSVVLCLSYLMSIFSPFPIIMASMLYGRVKGYLTALAGLIVCSVVAYFLFSDFVIVFFYTMMMVVASVVFESLKRNWHPVKTILGGGLVFVSVISLIIYGYFDQNQINLKKQLTDEIQQTQAKIGELQKTSPDVKVADVLLLEKPEKLAQEIIENVPSFFLMAIFFIFWANMYLSLRSRRLLVHHEDQLYNDQTLLKFKMPLYFVYPVIVGFVLYLFGSSVMGEIAVPFGMTILRALGVFYFFQGFGVLIHAFDQFGITGFFRTLLIMGLIVFASYLIAGIGLFDTFFEFDKKIKNKSNN